MLLFLHLEALSSTQMWRRRQRCLEPQGSEEDSDDDNVVRHLRCHRHRPVCGGSGELWALTCWWGEEGGCKSTEGSSLALAAVSSTVIQVKGWQTLVKYVSLLGFFCTVRERQKGAWTGASTLFCYYSNEPFVRRSKKKQFRQQLMFLDWLLVDLF